MFKKIRVMQSCEDANTIYLCIGKRRYIYVDGKYVGWYKP